MSYWSRHPHCPQRARRRRQGDPRCFASWSTAGGARRSGRPERAWAWWPVVPPGRVTTRSLSSTASGRLRRTLRALLNRLSSTALPRGEMPIPCSQFDAARHSPRGRLLATPVASIAPAARADRSSALAATCRALNHPPTSSCRGALDGALDMARWTPCHLAGLRRPWLGDRRPAGTGGSIAVQPTVQRSGPGAGSTPRPPTVSNPRRPNHGVQPTGANPGSTMRSSVPATRRSWAAPLVARPPATPRGPAQSPLPRRGPSPRRE